MATDMASGFEQMKQNLLDYQMTEQDFRVKLQQLNLTRSKINSELISLTQDYDRKIKDLQNRLDQANSKNDKLAKENQLYRKQIEAFQTRLVEKQNLIATLIAQQNQRMFTSDIGRRDNQSGKGFFSKQAQETILPSNINVIEINHGRQEKIDQMKVSLEIMKIEEEEKKKNINILKKNSKEIDISQTQSQNNDETIQQKIIDKKQKVPPPPPKRGLPPPPPAGKRNIPVKPAINQAQNQNDLQINVIHVQRNQKKVVKRGQNKVVTPAEAFSMEPEQQQIQKQQQLNLNYPTPPTPPPSENQNNIEKQQQQQEIQQLMETQQKNQNDGNDGNDENDENQLMNNVEYSANFFDTLGEEQEETNDYNGENQQELVDEGQDQNPQFVQEQNRNKNEGEFYEEQPGNSQNFFDNLNNDDQQAQPQQEVKVVKPVEVARKPPPPPRKKSAKTKGAYPASIPKPTVKIDDDQSNNPFFMDTPASQDFFASMNQSEENPMGEAQESSIDYADNNSVISNSAAKMLDNAQDQATGPAKKMPKKKQKRQINQLQANAF